ncbi:MAG: class I SAM-dependent methyltransferase [Bacteroidales bacterium]|nr:class I SAM-dependent methyltransferase [Bacteroidales bacterium]
MKKIKNRILKFAINKAKRSKLIQSLFEAPINITSLEKFGEFSDRYGNNFDLFNGLRSKLRPGWERILERKESQLPEDPHIYQKKANEGRITVEKIIPIINTFTSGIDNKTVLEIGCHSGAALYSLAEKGAKEVVGSEFSGYKIDSVGEERKIDEVNEELKEYRNRVSSFFKKSNNVRFVDDDICNSNLPSNYFDIICSWDVLEHLSNPETAFQNISRIIKPGGIVIQEYNPFFSLNGGHSLCTLDFLWGHVRLNEYDFVRYINEIRPNETEPAKSFYLEGLNRMTISDLKIYSKQAGLKIESIFKFTKEQHLRMLSNNILKQCQTVYPKLNAIDLVTPRIIIVHKKL